MEIIHKQDYVIQPWKNGRGSTKEIACRHVGDALTFRLSLAQVTSDGPFSRFEGFERILTVVSGDGMCLTGDGEIYQADPFCPVRFSGSMSLLGTCRNGPVENFNLIFNPDLITAEVQVTCLSSLRRAQHAVGSITALYLLSGCLATAQGEYLEDGDTCLYSDQRFPLEADENLRCICVTLKHH